MEALYFLFLVQRYIQAMDFITMWTKKAGIISVLSFYCMKGSMKYT